MATSAGREALGRGRLSPGIKAVVESIGGGQRDVAGGATQAG
jgi:hypothetical protein